MPDILKRRTFFILFLVSATIFTASLYKRVITLDDAFFAEQAYWWNEVGYVRSDLFGEVLDWGDHQYAYHKLHVWQNAIIAKYIGWSPYFFKAAPLVYLLVFCYFAFIYCKRYLSPDNPESFYLFLSLLFINTYIVHFGFESRPEIMMMSVGFLSFLSIRHGVKTQNISYLLLAGCLAGAAALFHLNGLIYITAGIGLIVYMRQYRYLALFIVSASIITSIYWYEMINNNAMATGVSQILSSPAVSPEVQSTNNFVFKLLTSPARFFSHLFDISYTLLLLFSLYFYRKALKGNYEVKLLLVYFIISELTLAIINPGNKSMYLILHMPFVLFIVSSLHNKVISIPVKRTMLIAFSLYAITQVGHIVGLIKKGNSEIIAQNAYIVKKYLIRESDKIIAPTTFIFNEIGNARISASAMFPLLAQAEKPALTCKGVFSYAKQHNYKFLILETGFLPEFSNAEANLDRDCPGYRRVGSDFNYYIFQAVN